MIELRWLLVDRPTDVFIFDGSVARQYRILQFRSDGGKWQDVPTVREEA